jgi:hypothetical protein
MTEARPDQKDLNHAPKKRLITYCPDPDAHGRPVDPTTGLKERTKGRTTVNKGRFTSEGNPPETSSHNSASQLESLR